MGREVRRVPKDWQHPKHRVANHLGIMVERYQPMFDRPFAPAMRDWYAQWDAWERGERTESSYDFKGSFIDWHGPPPDPAYYRPDWPEESRTHLMMYEDTTEGTPISPAFQTPEELARWLADNNASSFGSSTATYEQWLCVCKGAWAPSLIIADGQMMSGVEFAASATEPRPLESQQH